MIEWIRIRGQTAIVTAILDSHPLRQVKQLTTELRRLSFEGLVLFDLLIVNGLAENRFASMKFHQGQFNRRSFLVEPEIDPNIREEQDNFIKKKPNFLLASVLSREEIRFFLK